MVADCLIIRSLEAYYVYIHAYFPILPPPWFDNPEDRPVAPGDDNAQDGSGFVPSSPLSLAICTILSLIPHPLDRSPSHEDSVLLRREVAQTFAQSTLESIEIETEMPESATAPADALAEEHASFHRTKFHPDVPLELESTIALSILSVYEYAQRGNMNKMRARAGQALMSAMNLGIHASVDNVNHAEATRRAWWMTVNQLQRVSGRSLIRLLSTFASVRDRSSVMLYVFKSLPFAVKSLNDSSASHHQSQSTIRDSRPSFRPFQRMKRLVPRL